MLAGLVLMSALVGLLATGTAFALSAPAWLALAIYPGACSLTLLMLAAMLHLRTSQPAQPSMLHPQA